MRVAKSKGREALLRDIVSRVNKELKRSALAYGESAADIPGFIPTSCTLLDLALEGGIPYGRITEGYGVESIGKSTWAAHLMHAVQRKGGIVVMLDSEASMTPQSLARVGAVHKEVLWQSSYVVEDGFETIEATLAVRAASGIEAPLLFLWDTIAASPSLAEREGKAGMSDKARVISAKLRNMQEDLSKHGEIALVFLNQEREKIGGGGYGPQTFSPGGRAIRFHSSVRMYFSRASPHQLKVGERAVGINTRIKIIKLKYGTPFKEVVVPIRFKSGFDDTLCCLTWLLDNAPGSQEDGGSGVYTTGTKGGKICVDLPDGTCKFWMKDIMRGPIQADEELREFLRQQVLEHWTLAEQQDEAPVANGRKRKVAKPVADEDEEDTEDDAEEE